jgi:ABC-type transport system involved in multi-copper enzyme maturation permease subunit
MYLLENPVLQRELLVNLRMRRSFVLLFVYVAALGGVVYMAWPSQQRLDLSTNPEVSKRLVNMFFLGQYVLMSLVIPALAAGAFSGEKERQTYEMLLAAPLRPTAIVLGKLLASLSQLAVLVFASLPLVMLCLPLGGVSPNEVLATYVAMAAMVALFGMICVTASSYFARTASSLVVSYLAILPLVLTSVLFYSYLEAAASLRLLLLAGVVPAGCLVAASALVAETGKRLLQATDLVGEGREAVDPEEEQRRAVGMVIHSDQWPDRLFVPESRNDLMPEGTNPVYDKESRSELFGQGTLTLRLVIQLSMGLGMFLMGAFLFIWPRLAAWYPSYVVLFNMLVGPVFAAGTVTSERERQTIELLLTTTLSPWQILGAKLSSSLRVSSVLTAFLVWPLLLAYVLPPWSYVRDTRTMLAYLLIILVTSLTTTTVALTFSILLRKTSTAMVSTYLVLLSLFTLPVMLKTFAMLFFAGQPAAARVDALGFLSPFAAVFSLPLRAAAEEGVAATDGAWPLWTARGFVGFYLLLDAALLLASIRLFQERWRATA